MKYSLSTFIATAMAFTALGVTPVHALENEEMNSIPYVTGGVGDEERETMQAMKPDYNLFIESATKSGAYVGDTKVVISERGGPQIFETNAGPLFYAQLPPGRYTIEGMSQGQVIKKDITISKRKPANIHFQWTEYPVLSQAY